MPDDTRERGRDETSSNECQNQAPSRRNILLGSSALVAAAAITSGALAQAQKAAPAAPAAPAAAPTPAPAVASGRKPNILIIWGDDVGVANISAYSNGVMGYADAEHRPHRPGRDHVHRLLWRAVLHRGTRGVPHRSGGIAHRPVQGRPARRADAGMQPKTIRRSPSLLKPLGYATGQFGKNHLGDRNEFLPTVHGFDEFFGNLYHLNAEEEPEHAGLPEGPGLQGASSGRAAC